MQHDNIFIGSDALAQLRQAIADWQPTQVCVVADENTAAACYPLVAEWLPAHSLCVISAGEIHKTLDSCQHVWAHFTEKKLDRNALVLNVGGGMVGDLGGFCAATYKRGIRFVQLPTSLLAMVDASVGGKVGVDFMGYKNQLGAFQQPEAVFIYPPFLQTLVQREQRSGLAEIIKHHLIADAAQPLPKALPTLENVEALIRHSIAIKSNIVQQDPHERGIRKALNFGHTIGHAIESYFLASPTPLLHGEAIAAGMLAESWLSWQKRLLSAADFQAIEETIRYLYTDTLLTIQQADVAAVVEWLAQDKKNHGGEVRCTLLDGIGAARINQAISPEEATAAMRYLQAFA